MEQHLHATHRSILDQFLEDPRTTNIKYSHCVQFHIAVLVKRGKVIASATNRFGTRSRASGFSERSIHAEKNVVKELGDISLMRGADMLVMRFSRNSKLEGHERFLGSKPCPSCAIFLEKCMREYGLKNVYYTD